MSIKHPLLFSSDWSRLIFHVSEFNQVQYEDDNDEDRSNDHIVWRGPRDIIPWIVKKAVWSQRGTDINDLIIVVGPAHWPCHNESVHQQLLRAGLFTRGTSLNLGLSWRFVNRTNWLSAARVKEAVWSVLFCYHLWLMPCNNSGTFHPKYDILKELKKHLLLFGWLAIFSSALPEVTFSVSGSLTSVAAQCASCKLKDGVLASWAIVVTWKTVHLLSLRICIT